MRFPFSWHKKEYAIEPLRPGDMPSLALLHQEDFVRPWSSDEFAALLGQETVFGFSARQVGRGRDGPVGFVLARLAAGEAEILTIAVSRACRRRGIGRQLMEAVLRELHSQRAEALFLEVDENNRPAIALYRRLGFTEVGKRPAYYQTSDQKRSNALVMRRALR